MFGSSVEMFPSLAALLFNMKSVCNKTISGGQAGWSGFDPALPALEFGAAIPIWVLLQRYV